MFGLMRKVRRPTALRHLVSRWSRDTSQLTMAPTRLPSHHILCAGNYTPVFARLAAESAVAACPQELRKDLRLFIHVDGVAPRHRRELMSWLREIPGVELSYGLFGITPGDQIPGKWHQVMINDVVEHFREEAHIGFIDADLFLAGETWWRLCQDHLTPEVYAMTVGVRDTRTFDLAGQRYVAIKTNLFSLNTQAHRELNLQRFNKDIRAISSLRREFPGARINVGNIDTMIAGSLRAQVHGMKVIDVDNQVDCCHIGGFSHLRTNKFYGFDSPENRRTIEAWLGRLRLLTRVLDYFLERNWERFVDQDYRRNIEQARAFVEQTPLLRQLIDTVIPTRHELVFERLNGTSFARHP